GPACCSSPSAGPPGSIMRLDLPCRAAGQLSPHLVRLAFAGAPSHLTQILLKRFESVSPVEAAMRLVTGDHLGEGLEELVIVVVDMGKDKGTSLLGAW